MQKKIIICGLADIQDCVDKYNPDKMLTIINKNFEPETPLGCLLYTSPSPRDRQKSRMPSSA